MDNPLKYFAELRDPRVERNREHLLEEILLIAIAAVLSGAESWNDIAQYGEEKREWLQTFLTLPSGIPSHDTFNRVFAALDPEEMEKGFVAWVSSIAKLTAGEVVAIDGKTLCGTREAGKKRLVHMVSAWAEGNGLVLGQRKAEEKIQRNHGDSQAARCAGTGRNRGDDRRDGLPARDRQADYREEGRLRAGGQGQSGSPTGGRQGLVPDARRR